VKGEGRRERGEKQLASFRRSASLGCNPANQTMTDRVARRSFLVLLGAGAAAAVSSPLASAADPVASRSKIQPIRGSWISVQWSDRRHYYWNATTAKYTREQWEAAVREVAEIGMEYLVLLATVEGGKAFFDTPLAPKDKALACGDPIEAMLSAADKCGVKFFVSTGFLDGWLDYKTLTDPKIANRRFEAMAQVMAKFGHHRSFWGWYLPDEGGLSPSYFTDEYIRHVKLYSREARRLRPDAKILIAPWGTHTAVCDDKFVGQLERIDADIIAYQDEVGCRRATPETSAAAYERLRRAHDRVPQRALWADVEVFDWEGPANLPTSPLVPAPFTRVKRQLAAVSPFVDVVTIYQYQGLMSRPGGNAPVDHPDATKLYRDYRVWLRSEHPRLVK